MAYAPGSGYAPGGVSYYHRPPPKRKVKVFGPSPTTGYAPGGVQWRPIPKEQQVSLVSTGNGGVKIVRGAHGGGGGGGGAPAKKPAQTLWQQAQALIARALAPQIGATNAAYDRESARQQAAIAAATKNYQTVVGQYAPQMQAAYGQAQGAQASSDAALANLLSGKGGEAATNLAGLLGQPAGSEASASLGAVGRGAAATSYGMGSADLDRLISQGATAQEYGRKLPGLAALTGLEDTKSAMAALGQKRLDALGQIRGQGGTQTLNLWQQMVGRKAAATEAEKTRQFNREMAAASGLVKTGATNAKLGLPNAALSAKYGHIVDSRGHTIPGPDGKPVPVVKTGKKAGPPKLDTTASAVYKHQVDQYGHDILDPNGNTIPYRPTAKGGKTPQQIRATAIKNRGNQKTKALNDVRKLQRNIASNVSTTNPLTGKITTTTTKKPIPYNTVHRRAMALPSVQLLITRFGYTRGQVSAMIDQQLAAYGVKRAPSSEAPGMGPG